MGTEITATVCRCEKCATERAKNPPKILSYEELFDMLLGKGK